MSCEEIYELLSARLDGELSESEEARLQAHLDGCAECRRLYDAMVSIEENTAALEQPAPAGIRQGVLYRIARETGAVKSKKRRFWGMGTGIGLAAAVAVLLIGTNVIRAPRTTRETVPASAAGYELQADSLEPAETKSLTASLQTSPQESDSAKQYGLTASGDWLTQDSFELPPDAPEEGYADSWGLSPMSPPPEPAEGEPDVFPTDGYSSEPSEANDQFYVSGSTAPEEAPDTRQAKRPIPPQLSMACMDLSEQGYAPVLLYSEFSDESLWNLLQEEEPELYALFAELESQTKAQALGLDQEDVPPQDPESPDLDQLPLDELFPELDPEQNPDAELYLQPEEQMLVYTVDYQTLLALHEWLLQNLPRSLEMDEAVQAAEVETMIRMEELDPGSGALNRIITWTPRAKPIAWPEFWAEGWAVRMRTAENWALFYPEEDYTPDPEDLAYLVFLVPREEDEALEHPEDSPEYPEEAPVETTVP